MAIAAPAADGAEEMRAIESAPDEAALKAAFAAAWKSTQSPSIRSVFKAAYDERAAAFGDDEDVPF